jgi:ABC-type Fe3+-hydroxamate transport system substrate-binding protein
VGVTRFCIHPSNKVQNKTKIGGTKKFDIEKIKQLQPDLIIGNKEENYKAGIDELSRHFPVWMSDIFTLKDSFAMMYEIGRITNRQTDAGKLKTEIEQAFEEFQNSIPIKKSCAYFIWRKPYMVAAGNTFINEMLDVFGLVNVFGTKVRYPEISPEALAALNPDYIFLSSEPYSFSEKHFDEFQAFAPNAKVVLVDGEMFSWYGSRLRFAPAYFQNLRKEL